MALSACSKDLCVHPVTTVPEDIIISHPLAVWPDPPYGEAKFFIMRLDLFSGGWHVTMSHLEEETHPAIIPVRSLSAVNKTSATTQHHQTFWGFIHFPKLTKLRWHIWKQLFRHYVDTMDKHSLFPFLRWQCSHETIGIWLILWSQHLDCDPSDCVWCLVWTWTDGAYTVPCILGLTVTTSHPQWNVHDILNINPMGRESDASSVEREGLHQNGPDMNRENVFTEERKHENIHFLWNILDSLYICKNLSIGMWYCVIFMMIWCAFNHGGLELPLLKAWNWQNCKYYKQSKTLTSIAKKEKSTWNTFILIAR